MGVKTEIHEARIRGEIMLERVKDASSEREGRVFQPLRRRRGWDRREWPRQPEGSDLRAAGLGETEGEKAGRTPSKLGFFFFSFFEPAKQRCCQPT